MKVINRAQSSVEFTILIGVLLAFFLGMTLVVQTSISSKNFERQDLVLKDVAFTFQNEISLAYDTVDGYSRQFRVPEDILGLEYGILISDGIVFVNTTDGRHAVALPVFNITGQPIKGYNLIRKQNGTIYLNS